jgi:hypothetical protein
MIRVYVAGKYNGPNVIDVLSNMRKGIELSVEIMKLGFAPFVPWLDFQMGLHAEFDVETYKACSMEWVKVCDAVLLVPNQVRSAGVQAEIDMARKLQIPVYKDIDALIQYRDFILKNNNCNGILNGENETINNYII